MRRRRVVGLLGGCVAGSLSGCVSAGETFETYRYEQDAPTGGPVATPWRTQAYDARRSGYNPFGRLPVETAVDSFATAGRRSEVQPAFVAGVAYFGGRRVSEEDATEFGPAGFKASTGSRERWFVAMDGQPTSPTVVGDAIFVTNDDATRAFDRRDGTLCWEYRRGSSHPTAAPTALRGTVYAIGDRVLALTATTGEIRWATSRPETDFRGTAATERGVFATSGGRGRGAVHGFDPKTGRERWHRRTRSEVLVPPVVGEFVFAVEADGRILALAATDGREAWSRDMDADSSAMPAVADGTVYVVATDGGAVQAVDAATGELRWESTVDARRVVSPTVASDTVFVPAAVRNGGLVYEFAADTGTLRRTHELPTAPVCPLVVGSGVGLIGTRSRSAGTQFRRLGAASS